MMLMLLMVSHPLRITWGDPRGRGDPVTAGSAPGFGGSQSSGGHKPQQIPGVTEPNRSQSSVDPRGSQSPGGHRAQRIPKGPRSWEIPKLRGSQSPADPKSQQIPYPKGSQRIPNPTPPSQVSGVSREWEHPPEQGQSWVRHGAVLAPLGSTGINWIPPGLGLGSFPFSTTDPQDPSQGWNWDHSHFPDWDHSHSPNQEPGQILG